MVALCRSRQQQPANLVSRNAPNRITFFPCFYSSHQPSYCDRRAAGLLGISTLLRSSNDFYMQGHVPVALSAALLTVGVNKDSIRSAVDQIQAAITWTFSRCWQKRCQHMWKQKREKEKLLNEQEHQKRIEEYHQRLRDEEQQWRDQLASRVQLVVRTMIPAAAATAPDSSSPPSSVAGSFGAPK